MDDRFRVDYLVAGDVATARQRAAAIALEQTVEVPTEVVPAGFIADAVVGRLEDLRPDAGGQIITLSYHVDAVGRELPQLLNVVFGNVSLQPGVRVVGLALPAALTAAFPGPRFGIAGWRERLGVHDRPLVCSALKPLGLDTIALADLAYRMALGGVDLIKDDHGLADQPWSLFAERVPACAVAVARANEETGGRCAYLPNITGPADLLHERARLARQAGAGGLLVIPALVGLDAIRRLAADDAVALPIMSHPAFAGSLVTTPTTGMAHAVCLGQLQRLAGADAAVFPNWGGRFSFSREECLAIADACHCDGPHRSILPAPGGGMTPERLPELRTAYGDDVVFLMGGALLRAGDDLTAACGRFRRAVDGGS